MTGSRRCLILGQWLLPFCHSSFVLRGPRCLLHCIVYYHPHSDYEYPIIIFDNVLSRTVRIPIANSNIKLLLLLLHLRYYY
ncbi:hypothetical protein IW261DRAFT_1487366 [Armillaria novae-zelandiae]|uniref:Secreted protein n=1 Tax=Armillaria novae-zelandiae TaxID=153914 RepID=A0AA39P4Y0_9AGAR|nr:hypothetical protein IW261DRAFT_1487366 [Armillaria novae-zelandiae]